MVALDVSLEQATVSAISSFLEYDSRHLCQKFLRTHNAEWQFWMFTIPNAGTALMIFSQCDR